MKKHGRILRGFNNFLGGKQDVTINLRHIMDFGDRKLKIKVLNNGQIVDNMGDLAEIAARYV